MAKTPLFARLKRLVSEALPLDELAKGEASAPPLSRRGLLGAGLAAASVAACGTEPIRTEPPKQPPPHRIAVIGGGLAGLHCAYQLLKSGADVTLYEANERLGGRIFTHDLYRQNENLWSELGAEFFDTTHQGMLILIGELDVGWEDRLANEQALREDTYYFGGTEVPAETIANQFVAVGPALAAALTRANRDGAALRELDNTTLSDWLEDNVPADRFPELSALLFTAFRSEFGSEPSEQSALNLIFLVGSADLASFRIHGSSDRRLHVRRGNDQLIEALKFDLDLKLRIKTDSRLVRIEASGTATLPQFTLSFRSQTAIPSTAVVERVVFALPFSVLRQVEFENLGLSEEKQRLIRDLGYGTSSKMVAAFKSRVWDETHQRSGNVTSDLSFQELWDSSINQQEPEGVLSSVVGGLAGARADKVSVTESMDKLLTELDPIFRGVRAGFLQNSAVRMHWPSAPFSMGSNACLRPGQWARRDVAARREGNLHFCGEHCSLDFPGRMEGAVETSALVAAEIIDELHLERSTDLAAIMKVKTAVPQPGYQNGNVQTLGILDRLAAVERAHAPVPAPED